MSDTHASDDDLGLGLAPGDPHYRAFVGPPVDYDLVAAMSFNLLTLLGLRQHHRLLDIGCGSLRVGRLLIPYLNPRGYTGVEPERWLVEQGVAREVGHDQVSVKQPTFLHTDDPASLPRQAFDFALAQSVFSHCGVDVIEGWLAAVAERLSPQGALVATWWPGESDFDGEGWVYPGCVAYTKATIARLGEAAGLPVRFLDYKHPRQAWVLFAREAFEAEWIGAAEPTWNRSMAAGRWQPPAETSALG